MNNLVTNLKKALVALGHGSEVADYQGKGIAYVLKELAVIEECAPTVESIRSNNLGGILKYIADNKGSEEVEPYDLIVTAEHVSIAVKKGRSTLQPGSDCLYNGDKLTITAEADEGYTLTTLTVNGEDFESGGKFTVDGGKVTIVATGTMQTFDLARAVNNCTVEVTKGGETISDGENALSYGDEITITATATEGYTLTTLTVNGEDFVSEETLTVSGDVTIVAEAEAEATE